MVTLGGGGDWPRAGGGGDSLWVGRGRDGGEGGGSGMFKWKTLSFCRSSFRLILNVVGLS